MLTVALFAPKIGSNKAIAVGLVVFFALARMFLGLVMRLSILMASLSME